MNPFDNFLAESLEYLIKKKLGIRTFRKIERRLLSLYELTVSECISDFPKIDGIMREILGSATDKIETDLAKAVITVASAKNSVAIHDKNLSEKVMLSY